MTLSQGRYRWHHNIISRELTHILELKQKKNNIPRETQASPSSHSSKKAACTTVSTSNTVPPVANKRPDTPSRPGQETAIPSNRPDPLLSSQRLPNTLISVELTVLWEESVVHRPTHSVQRVWMTNIAVPCRGRLSWFSSTISMDHIELIGHSRKTTQSCSESARTSCNESARTSCSENARTSCRKSTQLTLAQNTTWELDAIQWRVVILWSLLFNRPESVLCLIDRNTLCRVCPS